MDTYKYPKEVEWEIDQNSKEEHLKLVKTINDDANISGVIIQHEYGIFGGHEGEKILYFMQHCKKSMLVTLHTVLPFPSPTMNNITAKIIQYASTIVVLTSRSKELVEQIYPGSIEKVFVIPHGIHPTTFSSSKEYKVKLELENHTILTTFGLLSPGKGIEYVINSLPEVIKKNPSILYLILGETHPVVRRNEGEHYRLSLIKLVEKLHLEKHVKFYDQYLSLSDLFEFLKATDIYISSSINPNQAVSGTLSYALGTGRAVISTEFAQSKEIVTSEIGRLVPIKDSQAISTTLLDLLSDTKLLKKMSRTAYNKTRNMLWSNVAEEYVHLLTRTVLPPLKIDHLSKMTDNFGLFQFAAFTSPNKAFGYTLDDNARALILCSWLIKQNYTKELEGLIIIYFNFIKKCLKPGGSFINYIDFKNKSSTVQNKDEDLEDAQARALWVLAEMINNNIISLTLREEAKKIFILTLNNASKFTHLRSKALAIKSFALVEDFLPEYREKLLTFINNYSESLIVSLIQNSDKSWNWFENHLQYNNGILPEALLIAASVTNNPEYKEKGLQALDFLIKKTFSLNMYRPIGNSQWYENNQTRSEYDQQPEDPASMILVLFQAYKITHNEEYKNQAKKCYSWFLGNNSLNISLYDDLSGGCYDGLHLDRVNLNQGAESLVSFLMSSYVIKELQ